MPKPKRLKLDVEKIATRERAEEVVREIAQAVIERDELTARMESKIQEIRENYEARLLEFALTVEQNMPAIQAWAELNPELFAEKKSLDMVHGTIGFRIGNPKCSPKRGLTWEKVKARIQALACGYLRETVEVDKEKIISDRKTLGEKGLAELGVDVYQEDKFFVEPKRESIPQ